MTLQTAIRCTFMRGGTSRGPYFHRGDLPESREDAGRVLLAVMGSPDARQINGLGGATTLTSKTVMVSKAAPGEAQQVDYLFAQVSVDKDFVDWGPTCGNMLAGIGPFAIEEGLVPAEDGETKVLIRAVNTGALIEAVVQTPGGRVTYDGDAAIAGVPGTAAPIVLNFADAVGGATGKLMPTGHALDHIEGVDVTCLDVAMPVVIARARDLGKTARESAKELDADKDFMARIERIRRAAGLAMGMGDVAGKVMPKFAMVGEPAGGQGVAARYFTPLATHEAMAVTGGICIASACKLPGTVAAGIAVVNAEAREMVTLEHPTGVMEAVITTGTAEDGSATILGGGTLRTARRIMKGEVYVPSKAWAGV
ncbi:MULTISPECIES: 4-oxalomesaconate tautomerase [Roseomonadaceae]|uniref:4-oxalomesaconate tautomerase n=1 Tax=Falsiroseomonas oleicola TaxID=2801474 RepID=A0ABS6HAG6_9PROT|nr:4-oxalomesaconate tautomerase [Roseomonas oleicola]MBU8545707.1 4-oxalomesaconate tautomerase [Roseomonas oleicola]